MFLYLTSLKLTGVMNVKSFSEMIVIELGVAIFSETMLDSCVVMKM